MIRNCITPRTLLICIFILLAGLSAGSFTTAVMEISDKQYLSEVISSASYSYFPAVLTNLAALLFIGFAGLTLYGFPLAAAVLLIRGFAVGFCAVLLLSDLNAAGVIPFILSYLIPHAMLCSIYVIAVTACIDYSMPLLRSRPDAHHTGRAVFIFIFVVLAVIVLIISSAPLIYQQPPENPL